MNFDTYNYAVYAIVCTYLTSILNKVYNIVITSVYPGNFLGNDNDIQWL